MVSLQFLLHSPGVLGSVVVLEVGLGLQTTFTGSRSVRWMYKQLELKNKKCWSFVLLSFLSFDVYSLGLFSISMLSGLDKALGLSWFGSRLQRRFFVAALPQTVRGRSGAGRLLRRARGSLRGV